VQRVIGRHAHVAVGQEPEIRLSSGRRLQQVGHLAVRAVRPAPDAQVRAQPGTARERGARERGDGIGGVFDAQPHVRPGALGGVEQALEARLGSSAHAAQGPEQDDGASRGSRRVRRLAAAGRLTERSHGAQREGAIREGDGRPDRERSREDGHGTCVRRRSV
jgi:hypothetical protein